MGRPPSKPLLPVVSNHLFTQDQRLREEAAETLRKNESPEVLAQLLAALKSSQRYISTRAAWGLSCMSPALVVPILEEELHGQDPACVELAAWALGRIRNAGARRVLVAALEDKRKHVKYRAAGGLWRPAMQGFKSKKAERLLAGMLKDDNGSAGIVLQRMRRTRKAPKARRRRGTFFKRMGGDFIR